MKIIKLTKIIALLFLVSIALFSCSSKDDGDPINPADPVNPVDPPVIKVKSISLNKTANTKTVGETVQLTATIKPSDATNKAVTWKSSNNKVASVNAEGKLTAKKEGTVVISVSTKDGNKSDQCTVKVIAPYIRMETTANKLYLLIDAAEADRPECWIDLNNNSLRDKGEEIEFKKEKAYSPTTKIITIYGKVNIFSCIHSQITKLDVSKNTKLEGLWCNFNRLTKLDISKNTKLVEFYCFHNQLTKLDLSKNKRLKKFSCYENQLTKLDISKNTKLVEFYCFHNQLTKLDVNKNIKLEKLNCGTNRLTTLDLGNNTKLKELFCSYSQLTKLDLSKNTKLTVIDCNDNKPLKSLNLANGKNGILTKVNAEYCPNLSCIQIDKGFTPNKNQWKKDSTAKWNNTGNPCQ